MQFLGGEDHWRSGPGGFRENETRNEEEREDETGGGPETASSG